MQLLRTFFGIASALVGLLLVAPVFAVALPLWVISSLTGVVAGWLEPRFVSWQQLIEFDPSIGWKPRPDLDIYCLTERDPEVFHVVTDSDGWPGAEALEQSEVVVFGDSYAFGFGVDAEDAFAATGTDLRIKAIGAPGYNMVQELMLMRDMASSLRGKLVVWLVYYGNDLYDNLSPEMSGYRTPFAAKREDSEEWEIISSHLGVRRWTSSVRRETLRNLADLHSRTPLAERAFSACEFLIRLGGETCTRAGAGLVVIGLPTPRTLSAARLQQLASFAGGDQPLEADLPDRELTKICGDLGVPFVAAREHMSLRDYRPVDDHWNRRGHRRMRRLLGEIHRDFGSTEDGADDRSPVDPIERGTSPLLSEARD